MSSLFKKIFKKKKSLPKKKSKKKLVSEAKQSEQKGEVVKKIEKAEKVAVQPMIEQKTKKIEKKKDFKSQKILLRPLITEKATEAVQYNKYCFAVPVDATKPEIRQAIQNVYGVRPIKINVVQISGKQVRYGRITGKTKAWKKAIITLSPEDKLEIYEGV